MSNDAGMLTTLFLGLLLGIRHALDADHVVAVTAIVSQSRHTLRSVLVGISWGLGHSIALLTAGFVMLVFRLTVPDRLALSLEFAVGIMLVLLGVPLLWRLRKAHVHVHQHAGETHVHPHSHSGSPSHDHIHLRRPLLVGIVHGLAGSGALTLLVLGVMPSMMQGLLFLLMFAAGTILGMLVFSGLISLPFRVAGRHSVRLNLWLQGLAGAASIVLGILVMWQTGAESSLFGFLA
ncbi:MAG: sulfite exporter TauE/SafE family protein [Chloroflexota bacterium]|nr:sulfite exporter TauE/SafE family protein [Chloroflexota bacterium]